MGSSKVESSPTHGSPADKLKKTMRKWQVYPGKNKFGCNGRCMCAPDYQGFICVLVLVIITGEQSFLLGPY